MNSLIYQLFFLILICIKSIHNYPNGAPVGTCALMTPNHSGVTSQSCSNKYTIQSDKLQYYTNETVQSKYIVENFFFASHYLIFLS